MAAGILLFAHGARDPRWAEPFTRIRDNLAQRCPTHRVQLCFLELMSPSLSEAVQHLIDNQCTELTLIPLFMAQGGHLRQDLPRLIDTLKNQHPQLQLRVTSALGDSPELLDAIAQWAVSQLSPSPRVAQPDEFMR